MKKKTERQLLEEALRKLDEVKQELEIVKAKQTTVVVQPSYPVYPEPPKPYPWAPWYPGAPWYPWITWGGSAGTITSGTTWQINTDEGTAGACISI